MTFSALVANPTSVPDGDGHLGDLPAVAEQHGHPLHQRRRCCAIRPTSSPWRTIRAAASSSSASARRSSTRSRRRSQPLLDAADRARRTRARQRPVLALHRGAAHHHRPGERRLRSVTAVKNLRLSPWSQIGPDAADPALQHYIRNANPSIAALNIPTDNSACAGQTLVHELPDRRRLRRRDLLVRRLVPARRRFPAGPQTICGQIPDRRTSRRITTAASTGSTAAEMEYPTITWYATAGGQAGIANANTAGTPDLASRTFADLHPPTGAVHALRRRARRTGRRELDRARFPVTRDET